MRPLRDFLCFASISSQGITLGEDIATVMLSRRYDVPILVVPQLCAFSTLISLRQVTCDHGAAVSSPRAPPFVDSDVSSASWARTAEKKVVTVIDFAADNASMCSLSRSLFPLVSKFATNPVRVKLPMPYGEEHDYG